MKLQIEKTFDPQNRCWTLTPDGEVDIATAAELRTEVDESFREHKGDIVIDLTGLSYMDSTGLGVIIGAYGRLKENNCTLQLRNPRENIRKLLRVTNLDKILCPEVSNN